MNDIICSLKAVRAQVFRSRLTSPLFNTRLYTQNLELLFLKMWDRYAKGLPPDHILLDVTGEKRKSIKTSSNSSVDSKAAR